MWALRLVGAANLPAVLPEILKEVAIVVGDHFEVELSTRQLRGPTERTFARVLFGNPAAEATSPHEEHNLVASARPSWVDASAHAVRHRGRIFGLDEVGLPGAIQGAEAQGLWVNAEGKAAIRPLPCVTFDEFLARLELTGGKVAMIFLYIQFSAELLDGLLGRHDLEDWLHFVPLPWFGEQILAHKVPRKGKQLERWECRWERIYERGINGLLLALKHGLKGCPLDHGQLKPRAIHERRTNVRIHGLDDLLFERVLRCHIGALVGRAGSFDANTRPAPTKGLESFRVFRGANLGNFATRAAQGDVVLEGGAHKAMAKYRAFLHDGAGHFAHARGKGATVEHIDERAAPGNHVGNVAKDSIGVSGGEVNCLRDGDTVAVGLLRDESLDFEGIHCEIGSCGIRVDSGLDQLPQ